jgi:Alpha-L-arabinofuranosidase B (ABFB) domain
MKLSPLLLASIMAGSTLVALLGSQNQSLAKEVCTKIPGIGTRCIWVPLPERIEEQGATTDPVVRSLPPLRSLQSFNFPSHFIRHADLFGYISVIDSDLSKNDATWRMRPGLASSQCYSFESKNFPGHYLRHQNLRIKIHQNDNTDLFKKDATFCKRSGLADSNLSSFESINFPNHFIRHRSSELWVDPRANDDLYKKDATFRITLPLIR